MSAFAGAKISHNYIGLIDLTFKPLFSFFQGLERFIEGLRIPKNLTS